MDFWPALIGHVDEVSLLNSLKIILKQRKVIVQKRACLNVAGAIVALAMIC